MNDEERTELGRRIAQARRHRGMSKEEAARRAEVTTTTWRRAEDGLRVHDHKLEGILRAVGIADASPSSVNQLTSTEVDGQQLLVMPTALEEGFGQAFDYLRTVQRLAPPLHDRASRAMGEITSLLSAAMQYLLEQEGGDGDAENSRGSAPTRTQADYGLVADEDDVTIEDEQEQTEQST